MAAMSEVKVASLGLDKASNTPVVILQEMEGERVLPIWIGPRVLPIWIGPGEASAIAMQLAGMKFSRPLTHDLLVSAIGGLGGDLHRVNITRVVENTYYAELIIRRDGEYFSLDARPSDSIAVALRMSATIYTSDELLENTAIEIAEASEFDEDDAFADSSTQEEETEDVEPPEDLKEYLRRLNPEDFGRFTP